MKNKIMKMTTRKLLYLTMDIYMIVVSVTGFFDGFEITNNTLWRALFMIYTCVSIERRNISEC